MRDEFFAGQVDDQHEGGDIGVHGVRETQGGGGEGRDRESDRDRESNRDRQTGRQTVISHALTLDLSYCLPACLPVCLGRESKK